MIRVILIEDELPARKKLRRFLAELDEPVSVIAEAGTVAEATGVLELHPQPDLILSDIELLDGNVFEVFEQVHPACPVIFTTAYDQYWMNAFETEGIEYLLKPFSLERFRKAWEKFLRFRLKEGGTLPGAEQLLKHIIPEKPGKKRFAVRSGPALTFVETDAILYFTAEEGVVFATDTQGKRHWLTASALKEVEEALRSSDFFKINRSQLVHRKYIERVERYTKNSLSIKMKGHATYLVTSQGNTAGFREWLDE